jgi:hypothetical protein
MVFLNSIMRLSRVQSRSTRPADKGVLDFSTLMIKSQIYGEK